MFAQLLNVDWYLSDSVSLLCVTVSDCSGLEQGELEHLLESPTQLIPFHPFPKVTGCVARVLELKQQPVGLLQADVIGFLVPQGHVDPPVQGVDPVDEDVTMPFVLAKVCEDAGKYLQARSVWPQFENRATKHVQVIAAVLAILDRLSTLQLTMVAGNSASLLRHRAGTHYRMTSKTGRGM